MMQLSPLSLSITCQRVSERTFTSAPSATSSERKFSHFSFIGKSSDVDSTMHWCIRCITVSIIWLELLIVVAGLFSGG